jgi:prolycopene isomerase
MSESPRAVVIGSGIGGSAAAMLLAHAGVPVTLIEKNRRAGGSCSGYDKQGFHIDIGTHMFCRGNKGPLGEVLRRVGREGAIEFRRTRDIAQLRFPVRDGARDVIDGVARVSVPSDFARMPKFVFELASALRLPLKEALSAARLFTRILTMSEAEAISWDHRTLEEFMLPYCDHPGVVGVFGFLLGLYFIVPYWQVSAGEAILAFQRMAKDNALSYPRGGAIAIPNAYCRIAKERGADVKIGVGARRVLLSNGSEPKKVRGVELEDGTIVPANIVVSTSSARTTVMKLVGAEHFPEAYVDDVKKIVGSMIAVQAKIGLKKRLVDAGCIVGGVGDGVDLLSVTTNEMKEMFASVTHGKIPGIVPFYCPVPSNFDPDLAPPGHQLLTVCAVAPTSNIALVDNAAAWEEAMLRALEQVVPGLRENALFIDRFSVEFIEKWIGKEFGPAVSTAQIPTQVGRSRLPTYAPIRGLYLAGCCAGGRGVGTELAASSAMECVDRILVDHGIPLFSRAKSESTQGYGIANALATLSRFTGPP